MDFFQLYRDIYLLGTFFDTYAAICANQGIAIRVLFVYIFRVTHQFAVISASHHPPHARIERYIIKDSKILGDIHSMWTGHAVFTRGTWDKDLLAIDLSQFANHFILFLTEGVYP